MIWQPVLEKENYEFKSIKLCLRIDPVSQPAPAEGLGKYIQKFACTLVVSSILI